MFHDFLETNPFTWRSVICINSFIFSNISDFPYSFYNSIICESVNELNILYLWGNIQKHSFCAKINNLYLVVGRAIA